MIPRVHHRRARPTLRVLAEDLSAGWASPQPLRSLADGDHDDLHPLSELPHPIIAKAIDAFGAQVTDDNYVGLIASSTTLRLMEIKATQWRGGVWEDLDTGVRWLVVAGLAKGDHKDRDDFYARVERGNDNDTSKTWLPTDEDYRLLRRETAARLVTTWELDIQGQILGALRQVHSGGSTRFDIRHPVAERGILAEIVLDVAPVREDGYEADEIDVEVIPTSSFASSDLTWQLTTRVLISLNPPEQGWDRYKDTYSNIAAPGTWTARIADLERLVTEFELATSEPGKRSHYAHRQHLAGRTIEGSAVRALCGVFFVPTQDHDALPECPTCNDRLAELPH